eukprot:CAMPEP_0174722720 /NCGR_PEP_ID=MMETSP1094-20130205/39113_1 /TAXON_ID=156173 /ORGANISM="Chrysochromulina brevifilum, Strain UTEX LB 985" /LENGTH=64 /DNA_ID=CAMNT_0015923629 /DNA_START=168 /DNA_END=359 /DNA_ORIENTATION=-
MMHAFGLTTPFEFFGNSTMMRTVPAPWRWCVSLTISTATTTTTRLTPPTTLNINQLLVAPSVPM